MMGKAVIISLVWVVCIGAVVAGIVYIALCCIRTFNCAATQQREFKYQNEHIIDSSTITDPIQAIYEVRQWILLTFPNAGCGAMWYQHAYAVLLVWLHSEEANRLGIVKPRYVRGNKNGVEHQHWATCIIVNGSQQIKLIIDLTEGISCTYCQGGSTVHMSDLNSNDLSYIISGNTIDANSYVEREIEKDPDYRLI